MGRQCIFKPTSGNESSHQDSRDNGVKVVKHNAQLIEFTFVWQVLYFCLSHLTNISTLQTSSTYETLTIRTTFIYYHQHHMVRKSSWKKYKKQMGYASVLFKTATVLWSEWVIPLYLCWHLFCQQRICICNKWVSVWRLDAKYLESYTQNHTPISHTSAALSPQLLKVKYIYVYFACVLLYWIQKVCRCVGWNAE